MDLHEQLLDLYNKSKYTKVIALYQERKNEIDNNPLYMQVLAASYFQINEYEKTLDILYSIEAAIGNDINFLSMFGATLRRLGRKQEASKAFVRAINEDPTNIEVKNNYANLLIDIKDFSEAKVLLEEILQKSPDYEDAQINMNRLKFAIDSQSSEHIDLTLKTDPLLDSFSEEEVVYSDKVLTKGDKNIIGKLPKPNNETITSEKISIARQAIEANNPKFALDILESALHLSGCQSEIYATAADAYLLLKNHRLAENMTLHSIQLGGSKIGLFINMGNFCALRGDTKLAYFYMEKASEIDPEHVALLNLIRIVNKKKESRSKVFLEV